MKAGSVLTAAVWDEFILKNTLEEGAFPHRGVGVGSMTGCVKGRGGVSHAT